MKTKICFEHIIAGLRAIGLSKGANLLVHSSLKSFGYVQGGADTVINAIHYILGDKGTLMVPTLSFSSFNESVPFFDARNTPSDCGIITETVRKRPDAIRSLHPLSSVAAIGPNAQFFTKSHVDTPCGPESPYGKLLEAGGYSLFLGVGFSSNSIFHVAEEIVNPEYLCYKSIKDVKIIDLEGKEHTASIRRYNCSQTGVKRYLGKMHQVFQNEGVISVVKIGDATCYMISAEDNVRISSRILRDVPEFILSQI